MAEDKLYENSAEFFVDGGYINFCFEESEESINEAVNMVIPDSKNKDDVVIIYIRNKTEGKGSNIEHPGTITVKASSANKKEMVPYSVPKTENGVCEKKVPGYSDFDRKYGAKVKAFVYNTAPLIVEYWEADPLQLDKVQAKIEQKFKRYQKLKARGRIHHK